jgi:uncharacterized protein
MISAGLVVLGVIAGVMAGILGVGGGIIIVPALVFIFGFTQKMALGTSLALLLPPIGILAAYTYYRAGQVDVKAALIIIVGFLIGSFFGAHYAKDLDGVTLTRVFGFFLLAVAIKMILTTK